MKRPFYLLCFLIFLGCDYALEDEYFKVVAPPHTEDVQLTLPEVGDTIYLFTKTLLKYRIDPGAREVLSLEAFLDEEPISLASMTPYSFWVDARTFSTGYYPLRLELTVSGGTGSLADVAGAEKQKFRKEWTVFMDKTPPGKVEFKDIYPESGTLMLSWNPYQQKNFQAYELEKYCYDEQYEKYYLCDTVTIAEQSRTTIADSTFIGGTVLYKIRVKGSDQYSGFTEKAYAYDIDPQLRWQWLAENDLEIRWEESPFYQNLKHYELVQKYGYNPHITTSAADTINFYSFVFGEWTLYNLKIVPKSDHEKNSLLYTTEVFKGEKVQATLNAVSYNQSRNRYYTLDKGGYYGVDTLMMIDAGTNEIMQKLVLADHSAIAISPDGRWLYAAYGDELLQIDPNTLSVQQTYSFSSLENKEASMGYGQPMFVNNSNHLTLGLSTGNFIIDMNTYAVRHRTFDRIHMVSPDGSQLYKKGNLHQWNGSSYVEEGPFYQTRNLREVAQYSPDSLLLFYNDMFRIVDARNGMEIKSVPIATEWHKENVISYDPVYHLLGQYIKEDNGKEVDYQVYNLATGASKNIRIANTDVYGFKLLNNKLICSKGYILSLD